MQASLTPLSAGREPSPRKKLAPLPAERSDVGRVAVLLNKNARRVNDALAKDLESVVGKDNLFYSRSLDEAEAFAREIVQRGYGTVVCGGGDGTLARTVNLIQHYVAETNHWRSERYRRYGEWQSLLVTPRFGFLRLGTGNAIGRLTGAGEPMTDLARMVRDGVKATCSLPLIDLDGERCFFAGMGYDSLLLNDYNWLKARTQNPLGKRLMHSVVGYFAALMARTLPSILLRDAANLRARVTTRARAYFVDPRKGDAVSEIDAGTTLFEGPAAFIGAGTSPFYGYGMKIFPFARMMPGMMNLRVANIGPVSTLSNLPSLWKGSYRNSESVFDFLASDVEIDLADPYPFQHSGDAQGLRKSVRMRIAEEPLDLVDLHHPTPVLQ
jgi:diacylglycerol kinase family enzyme